MLYVVWVHEPFERLFIVPDAESDEDALSQVVRPVLIEGAGLVKPDDDIQADVIRLDPDYWRAGFALDPKDKVVQFLMSSFH
jgi:hypothetical protein